nr:dihydroorotate dehydrogenase electron transfer subunit [candidate division Zixibacteria bacterium]
MSKIVIGYSEIIKKTDLGRGNFIMEIAPFSKARNIKPGQFVHIRLPDTNVFFRRAFSIYDYSPEQKTIKIIFKVFGRGTKLLAGLHRGDRLDVLGPLGNGFRLPGRRETVILVAGGIGMPPIYLLAKILTEKGFDQKRLLYFYGGATRDDLVELKKIRQLGVRVYPATEDGSLGFRGLITGALVDVIDSRQGKFRMYACGPEGMLRAVDELAGKMGIPGQLSLEAPMPCGIGICLGCIKPLRVGGYTRICREGPVYEIGEVIL